MVTTGSIWKGSPTTTTLRARQIAPSAACGTACPASSINNQGILPCPKSANIRLTEANVVETTGITNQKVFHMASISSEETNVPPFKYWKKPSRVVLILLDFALALRINISFTCMAATNNSDCNSFNRSEYHGQASCVAWDSIFSQKSLSAYAAFNSSLAISIFSSSCKSSILQFSYSTSTFFKSAIWSSRDNISFSHFCFPPVTSSKAFNISFNISRYCFLTPFLNDFQNPGRFCFTISHLNVSSRIRSSRNNFSFSSFSFWFSRSFRRIWASWSFISKDRYFSRFSSHASLSFTYLFRRSFSTWTACNFSRKTRLASCHSSFDILLFPK